MKIHCPICSEELKGSEKFCPSCGAPLLTIDIGDKKGRSEDIEGDKISCEKCKHYREVIPISTRLPKAANKHVNEAHLKIKEEETKQMSSETQIKIELIKIQKIEWGFYPLMSSFCSEKAEKDVYEICEVKNREENCGSFQRTEPLFHICDTCIYRNGIDDPYRSLYGITNSEIHSKMKDGIDMQWAVEVSAIYANKGKYYTVPEYHEWCQYLSGDGYMALPYPNIHNDCRYYERGEGNGKSFL